VCVISPTSKIVLLDLGEESNREKLTEQDD
jgi:hypothetical protein